jgi:hypothetical protein
VVVIATLTAMLLCATGSAALVAGKHAVGSSSSSRRGSTLRLDSLDGLELRGIDAGVTEPVKIHALVADYRGRRGLRIVNEEGTAAGSNGAQVLAIVRSSDFQDGTIELDVAGLPRHGARPDTRGFIGIAFRVQDRGRRYEAFYLRMTNGRADDQLRRNHSAQYISQPDFPWNRLRNDNPGMYESYVDISAGEWTRMKIEVAGATARLYVNGASEPCLIVKDLKLGEIHGQVALWIGSDTAAYFSNLTIQ